MIIVVMKIVIEYRKERIRIKMHRRPIGEALILHVSCTVFDSLAMYHFNTPVVYWLEHMAFNHKKRVQFSSGVPNFVDNY